MDAGNLTQLIVEYRYLILIPLAFLEGPIVALVAGTLAAAGYFNPFVLEIFFIIRDIVNDVAYYGLGVLVGKSTLVRKLLRMIGITTTHLKDAERLWQTKPLRTMFLSKISYGIAPSFFVVAGMVRMSLSRFIWYNAVIAAFQYGVLLIIGYYFGSVIGLKVFNILNNAQYIIGGVVLIYIVLYFVRSFFGKRLLEKEEHSS